ncbi:MAG: flagellar basal-body rod protein FlgG [Planctomycetota bacterium]
MATNALHSAATGLKALSTELDVLANNLANVNTVGFKGSRVNFEDLMYQHKKQPGVENAAGTLTPAGLQVGLGTSISNTQYDFAQGSAQITERSLDANIAGDGFFKVTLPNDLGGGVGYTRAGNFFRNNEGSLVLGNSSGYLLEPGITIPDDVPEDQISIGKDGTVSYTDNAGQTTNVGQLELATFVNKAGLKSVGGNVFIETDASGPPIEGEPGTGGLGTIEQGFLEQSNVDPVKELVNLIKTQRAFELNSQTIQAADEVMQVVGNLRR